MTEKSRGKGCITCEMKQGKTCWTCLHQQDIANECREILKKAEGK